MAESIALFFRTAGWDEIAAELSGFAGPGPLDQWFHPAPPAESSVAIYRYDDDPYLLDEYEPDEVDRLLAALGGFPSAILAIELRRSQGRRALDDAAAIALRLLRRFDGVAEDVHDELWTLREMEEGAGERGRFLDAYRAQLTPDPS